jgi:hypothetical protein
MASDTGLTRHDLEAKIVKRCWEDEAFCKAFTADPEGVFVRYLQIPAASLPKIVVHEESAGSWHIVLPPGPANAGELSERDLESVAGGYTDLSFAITAGVSTFASLAGTLASVGVTVFEQGW